jgi:FemAB-related protein (PEP-CTERM system-associated)
MTVREIQPGEEAQWNAYVRTSPHSTPQTLFAWKTVMEEVFHSETHYILAEDNGTITGVLPLIHIKSLLAGHYVTSQPGGICADNQEVAKSLFESAKEFVIAHKAKYLILRDSRKKWEFPELVTDEEHITLIKEITQDPEQLFHTIDSKARQKINKTSRNGLHAEIGIENLNKYYPTYARAMRELGTPTLGLDFFKCMAAHLHEDVSLITLVHFNEIVGGGFIAPFQQTIYCLWSGLLRKHYNLNTSYLLTWTALKLGYEKGLRWVDLGRCKKDSGTHRFKEQFNPQIQQLYQQIFLNGIDRAPNVGAQRASDNKYRLFVKLWRVLPVSITEVFGPILRRQVPFG